MEGAERPERGRARGLCRAPITGVPPSPERSTDRARAAVGWIALESSALRLIRSVLPRMLTMWRRWRRRSSRVAATTSSSRTLAPQRFPERPDLQLRRERSLRTSLWLSHTRTEVQLGPAITIERPMATPMPFRLPEEAHAAQTRAAAWFSSVPRSDIWLNNTEPDQKQIGPQSIAGRSCIQRGTRGRIALRQGGRHATGAVAQALTHGGSGCPQCSCGRPA